MDGMIQERETVRGAASALLMRDLRGVLQGAVDLAGYRAGLPQRAGAMTVVPIFGRETEGIVAPNEGLTLRKVYTYGDVELENKSGTEVAIAPLHLGFIQHGAQNHALCRSALIGPGRTERFRDACCVQAAQSGYLEGKDQWFFILPYELRGAALRLRGEGNYSKLWEAIQALNETHGLPSRGHLEQILVRQRAYLTQYRSRFERWDDQVGAFFFVGDRLVGAEIAPSAEYFRDVWMPLVCFTYGVAAMRAEQEAGSGTPEPFAASTLDELRAALLRSREERDDAVRRALTGFFVGSCSRKQEQRLDGLRLCTVQGERLAGQVVESDGGLVYASLFAVGAD